MFIFPFEKVDLKSVHIQSFSGQYFPTFILNKEILGISLYSVQCRKKRTRKLRIRILFTQCVGWAEPISCRWPPSIPPWKHLRTKGFLVFFFSGYSRQPVTWNMLKSKYWNSFFRTWLSWINSYIFRERVFKEGIFPQNMIIV